MPKGFREIRDYMESQGFTFVGRTGRTHPIWSDGKVTVVSSGSTASARIRKHLAAAIRRARRESGG